MRTRTLVFTLGLLLSFLARARAAAAAPDDPGPQVIRFVLHDGNSIVGYHYASAVLGGVLLIAIHGASDTHTVFDFAADFRPAPGWAHEGIDVLTLDRVGYGASSHPNGDSLDFATSAGYVHEVIQDVRGGALGYTPSAVVLLGPSVGADLTIVEAGTYRDVDGAIICANTAQLQPAIFQVNVGAWFAQGPYFDFGVDFRTNFFYTQPWALQWVIDLDNATRSLVPRAEIGSALANGSAPFRSLIVAPVLLVQADHDHIFVPQDDTLLFSGSADV